MMMTITIKFFYRKSYILYSPSIDRWKDMEWLVIATLGILATSMAQVFYHKKSERRVKSLKKEVEKLETEKKSLAVK
jgi:hypothetical protein